MKDGTFTYYALQHRQTHKSPWLKPDKPLVKVHDRGWAFSSHDYFGYVFDPRIGSGNTRRPQFKKPSDEIHNVWATVGDNGWWTLRYAVLAAMRAEEASEAGLLNHKTLEGHVEQAARYKFRIVKLTVSKTTEVVLCDDLMKELSGKRKS